MGRHHPRRRQPVHPRQHPLQPLPRQPPRPQRRPRTRPHPYTTLQRTGTFLCTELAHGNDAGNLQTTATLNPKPAASPSTPPPRRPEIHAQHQHHRRPQNRRRRRPPPHQQHRPRRLPLPHPLTDTHGTLPTSASTASPPPRRPRRPLPHLLRPPPLPRTALLQAHHGRLTDDNTFHSPLGNRRKRFLTSINRVTTGKLCMSAAAVGATRAALTIAVRYSHHRHITGPRPGQHTPCTPTAPTTPASSPPSPPPTP